MWQEYLIGGVLSSIDFCRLSPVDRLLLNSMAIPCHRTPASFAARDRATPRATDRLAGRTENPRARDQTLQAS
jgi:hypothetical protein